MVGKLCTTTTTYTQIHHFSNLRSSTSTDHDYRLTAIINLSNKHDVNIWHLITSRTPYMINSRCATIPLSIMYFIRIRCILAEIKLTSLLDTLDGMMLQKYRQAINGIDACATRNYYTY